MLTVLRNCLLPRKCNTQYHINIMWKLRAFANIFTTNILCSMVVLSFTLLNVQYLGKS